MADKNQPGDGDDLEVTPVDPNLLPGTADPVFNAEQKGGVVFEPASGPKTGGGKGSKKPSTGSGAGGVVFEPEGSKKT
jgi:hypothetical protein